jgi:hypothetical protein
MNYYRVEDQVLIGTVLGGSSLVKPPKGVNYYLSMRSQNEKWLLYKMTEMPSYFKEIKLNWCDNTYRCNSCCSENLTELHGRLYDNHNKRKITMEILDTLMDVGIAVWFLESGSKTGRDKKNAYINTTKFGLEGTNIIKEYFNSVDMQCNINRDKNRLKVLFTVDGTESLLKTVAHRFPSCMYHRI